MWVACAGLAAGWTHAGVLADYDADSGSPASAAAIQSPVVQGWTEVGTGTGATVDGVVDGMTFAWRISDDASGLNPAYRYTLTASQLQQMYRNGWECKMVVRAVRGSSVSGYCAWGVTTANDPGWGLTDRERVGFSAEYISATDSFRVNPTHGGGAITLSAGSAAAFHTLRCVGISYSPRYEFFVDGVSRGIFDIRDGSSNGNFDDTLRFASGSTAGVGREAEWNRVRLAAYDLRIDVKPTAASTVVNEQGTTSDGVTARLTQSPTAAVTVTVAPDGGAPDLDLGAGPGAPIDLVFSSGDWGIPQPVTVTAVDDAFEELDEVVTVTATASSADPFYDGERTTFRVTVLDNDVVDPQPLVDAEVFISPQHFNQGSFVTTEGDYHTFRIPSLIVAPDESLIAFAEGRRGLGHDPRREDNAPMDLVMKRSTDGGVSWGPLEILEPGFQPNGWRLDFADPTAVVDATAVPPTVWVVYGQHRDFNATGTVPGNNPDPAYNNHVVWARSSTNNGLTWAERVQILEPVGPPDSPDGLYWNGGEPGPGNGIQLRRQVGASVALNGRLVIPAKRSGSATLGGPSSTQPFVYYSDDHGVTWQSGIPTAGPNANEDEVVELTGGRILLDARQTSGTFRRRHLSSDGGGSWGADFGDDVPITPVDCSVDRYSARMDGDDRDRILFSAPAGGPAGSGSGRYNITVWTSYDEGASFINPVQIQEGPAAYSVVRTLPDGDIGVLVETDGDEGVIYDRIEYFEVGIDFLEGMIHPRGLTHYDGFGNRIERARGGTGWSGSWSAGATFSGVPEDVLGSASISFPGFDRTRSFGRVDLVGAQSTVRSLGRGIDLGVDDRAYISVLVSRQLDVSPDGSVGEELRIELRDAGGGVEAAFGVDSEEAFFVDGLGTRQAGSVGGLSLEEPNLLVLKIVSQASGADQLLLKAFAPGSFGSGEVESDVSWTVIGSAAEDSTAVLDQFALVGNANAHWSVDEIRIGETWTSVAGEDTDEDGLDDAWEIKHFTTLGGSNGSGDADGDGLSDADEERAGTDPRSAVSRFDAGIRQEGATLSLSWPSAEGRDYRVDRSLGLSPENWLPAHAGISATPPTNSLMLPPSSAHTFYRIAIEP